MQSLPETSKVNTKKKSSSILHFIGSRLRFKRLTSKKNKNNEQNSKKSEINGEAAKPAKSSDYIEQISNLNKEGSKLVKCESEPLRKSKGSGQIVSTKYETFTIYETENAFRKTNSTEFNEETNLINDSDHSLSTEIFSKVNSNKSQTFALKKHSFGRYGSSVTKLSAKKNWTVEANTDGTSKANSTDKDDIFDSQESFFPIQSSSSLYVKNSEQVLFRRMKQMESATSLSDKKEIVDPEGRLCQQKRSRAYKSDDIKEIDVPLTRTYENESYEKIQLEKNNSDTKIDSSKKKVLSSNRNRTSVIGVSTMFHTNKLQKGSLLKFPFKKSSFSLSKFKDKIKNSSSRKGSSVQFILSEQQSSPYNERNEKKSTRKDVVAPVFKDLNINLEEYRDFRYNIILSGQPSDLEDSIELEKTSGSEGTEHFEDDLLRDLQVLSESEDEKVHHDYEEKEVDIMSQEYKESDHDDFSTESISEFQSGFEEGEPFPLLTKSVNEKSKKSIKENSITKVLMRDLDIITESDEKSLTEEQSDQEYSQQDTLNNELKGSTISFEDGEPFPVARTSTPIQESDENLLNLFNDDDNNKNLLPDITYAEPIPKVAYIFPVTIPEIDKKIEKSSPDFVRSPPPIPKIDTYVQTSKEPTLLSDAIQSDKNVFGTILELLNQLHQQSFSKCICRLCRSEEELNETTNDGFPAEIRAIRKKVLGQDDDLVPKQLDHPKKMIIISTGKLKMVVKTDEEEDWFTGKVGNLELILTEEEDKNKKDVKTESINTDNLLYKCKNKFCALNSKRKDVSSVYCQTSKPITIEREKVQPKFDDATKSSKKRASSVPICKPNCTNKKNIPPNLDTSNKLSKKKASSISSCVPFKIKKENVPPNLDASNKLFNKKASSLCSCKIKKTPEFTTPRKSSSQILKPHAFINEFKKACGAENIPDNEFCKFILDTCLKSSTSDLDIEEDSSTVVTEERQIKKKLFMIRAASSRYKPCPHYFQQAQKELCECPKNKMQVLYAKKCSLVWNSLMSQGSQVKKVRICVPHQNAGAQVIAKRHALVQCPDMVNEQTQTRKNGTKNSCLPRVSP